ncbi:MAG: acyl-CoA dehydrogenase family protein [Pseudomonadota bacterium]
MTLTPAEESLVAAARDFAERELVPMAMRCEQSRAHDPDLFRRAAGLGLIGIQIDAADGGLGFSFACKSRVAEQLARADYGLSMAVINSHNAAHRLARLAPAEMKARLLPRLLSGEITGCTAMTEPGAGSDFAAIGTTARREAGGWRIDGAKTWVTNARHASLAVLFAQTGEIGDAKGVAGFLVELTREGVRRRDDGLFAEHGTGVGGFELSGYRAAEDECVLPPGGAFRQILSEVNGARVYLGAMCCGMVESALDEAAAYGARRRSFGRPLSGHQGWRWTLARAETDLAAARGLVRRAEAALDAGEDVQLLAAQAKIFATDMAVRRLPELMHAMGAEGLRAGGRLTRHLAGAQATTLADGSTEMLLERVAKLSGRGA